jgi:PKD repeat protein
VDSSVSGFVPLPVTFTDSSTGTITNRAWNFGDGTFINTQLTNVTHTYTTAGNYTVELIVSGDAGSDTYTQVDLIAASNLPPGVVLIGSDLSDSSIGVNASGIPSAYNNAQVVLYAGDDNYNSSKGDACAVVVFELPDLGGDVITAASLAADIAISNPGATNYPVALDLWGSRYSDSATVLTNDYGFKETGSGTKLQDDIISIPGSGIYDWEVINTDALGDAALVAWLNAQYDDGAVAGDFVFLRYQSTDFTTGAFQIASAHKTDPARTVPILTIMVGDGSIDPPPASVVSFGASFGNGQDVVNWTTTQGFGYVYSVYYSTDLVTGFLPLQTDLPDTVQSLTNTIDAPVVFYKIEAQ